MWYRVNSFSSGKLISNQLDYSECDRTDELINHTLDFYFFTFYSNCCRKLRFAKLSTFEGFSLSDNLNMNFNVKYLAFKIIINSFEITENLICK